MFKKVLSRLDPAVFAAAAAVGAALLCANFSAFAKDASDLRGEVVRLHILANSDSEEDQRLKLALRDEILPSVQIPAGFSRGETLSYLETQLPRIKTMSEDFIKSRGFDYSVSAEVANMYFTTREYDNFLMPAGDYDALRLTIGDGGGRNWWCVLYPPLCLPAAAGSSATASATSNKSAEDYFSKRTARELMQGKKRLPRVKFAVYEALTKIRRKP